MNTPVSFEIAKLLKEKGFNSKCRDYYDDRGYCTFIKNGLGYYRNEYIRSNSGWKNCDNISAPTIAEVVMWLYEKHKIWIIVTPYPYSKSLTHWKWEHKSTDYDTRAYHWKKVNDYMSPTEAYSAAIEYCLTKLI